MSLLKYILKKMLMLLPVLVGISIIAFALGIMSPGDPVDQVLNPNGNESYTQAEYDALIADMENRIRQVEDSDARDLLTKRYLEFKPWAVIASEFGYSVQNIYRLHTKVLEKLRVDESS